VLLDHPRPVRVARHTGEPDLPRPKFDEEQDVQRRKVHGLHGEEVRRDDAGGLRPQKRSPGDRRPSRRGPKPVATQHRPDGGRRHQDPQLLELTLDTPVAPAGVLPGQPQDQRHHWIGERWTATSTVGLRPLAGHQAPVPPQDRSWRHQERLTTASEEAPGSGLQESHDRRVGTRLASPGDATH